MQKPIVIGSRGSDLALWQAHFVQAELARLNIPSELKIISTKGDQIQHLSLDKLEGKGFFTKEIEEALLNKEIDLAVHSHKDLPTDPVPGLIIAAVSDREDPSEILLIRKTVVDPSRKFGLPENAVVGTSSARRKSQLLSWRPDIQTKDLRGNVPTRIQKLRDIALGYDAILIAFAGVSRLEIDLSEFHTDKLDPRIFIPAPAQGVLALQIRAEDTELKALLRALDHPEIAEAIAVERKILNLFDGGCQLPLGAYCEKTEDADGQAIFNVSAAKADAWDQFPRHVFLSAKRSEGLAERVVNKLNTHFPANTQIFISRDIRKNDLFKSGLEARGCSVSGCSLIDIKRVPMRKYTKTDWVFFSSKHAVRHFMQQQPDVDGCRFATVGKSTAEELRKFGKRADFIGDADNTKMTGKKFAALAGSKSILFPQAKESMRTIQLQVTSKTQVIDLVVYETVKNTDRFEPPAEGFDVYVFTSPSNVDTFYEKHRIPAHSKVVAMGDATANALRKHGVKTDRMPASFDDLGLLQAVSGLY